MTAYNKLFAAILSTLAIRWFLTLTGINVTELGVDTEFRALVTLGFDAAVAGLNGFFVWLIPNKPEPK